MRPFRGIRPGEEYGFALPLALLLCLALGFSASAASFLTLTAGRIALNFDAFHRALDVAEGGLDRGVELLASAYEGGASVPDSVSLLVEASLNGFTYEVRAEPRREPDGQDLNGNGIPREVVRYDRAWGYEEASAAGTALDPGEAVWWVTSTARGGRVAEEELVLEVAFERDPAVPAPAVGAWRVIPLRWSSLVDRR